MSIRNTAQTKAIEDKIRKDYASKKLKDVHIKKFLTNYYDGDPSCECPNGCKANCQLDCYIEIQQAMIDDDGNVVPFKTPYFRDNSYHCCGKEMAKLPNKNIYCTVCGNEYE